MRGSTPGWMRVAVLTMLCWSAGALAADAPAGMSGMSRGGIDVRGWADTRGGAGGRIVRVTNLNASGAGSFAEAVAASGPRIVVFEVGGVIDLQGASIRIREPYLTIAGQTAPGPGITFIRGEFSVATHDVIVQHIAVRPGEAGRAKKSGWEADGLSTSAADNVIIDHCSFSWATDENLSASGPRFKGANPEEWRQGTSRRVTFSHNIVAEGLRDSTHKKGEHSKGTLVHDNASQVLIYGNLYNANHERNPLIKGGAKVAVVNNLVHDFGARAMHYNLIAHEWGDHAPQVGVVTLVGNVVRGGDDSRPGVPLFSLGGAGDVSLYLRDNLALDANGKPMPQTGSYTASGARILEAGEPYLPPGLQALPAARLENAMYASAGMRPWARDPVDFKIISDVAEGRGHIVDSEAQSSGYPAYAPARRPFDPAEWNLADMSPRAGWEALFR
ncbi:hypothetical protein LQ564_22020 [Massilia sp. G4R7]|uniref:Pectate lyase n=1 Tax=Massilia phyllostachyos TaxID=2898585 RepID=A0ABS8QB53_9BURK|nr:hypothetical protein [Massilia phyllostachyos]MCD2518982.1 hypothetical protein [Massilia phyllostachyos]